MLQKSILALKMESVQKKKMCIAQGSDNARLQSLPTAKQEQAEESLVGRNSDPLFCSEKIFPRTANNVEISRSLN